MIAETYDAKGKASFGDLFNHFSEAKKTGVLQKNEFSELIAKLGNMIVNTINQGKMTSESIESVESYVSTLVGPNADKYFGFPHEGLTESAANSLNSIRAAKQAYEQRRLYTSPANEQENYENTFRKLGH